MADALIDRPPDAPPIDAPDPFLETTRRFFGIDYLYPYQRLVVANTLDGDRERRGQIVVLPTGSGKSLCFSLPVHLMSGATLVVYPLIALMKDQLRRMGDAGIETRILRGGQRRDERAEVFNGLRAGQVRCVLANPEVLENEATRRELATCGIEHLVIDEAHCVTEWGETFRPSYLTLGELAASLAPRMTTAFTATASPTVLAAVRRTLFPEGGAHLLTADPDRPNIRYHVVRTPARDATLRSLVKSAQRPLIVFCRSRKRVEAVARELADSIGFLRTGAYHAGLTREERSAVEAWFMTSSDGALAATCAYGMGVDKPDVRTVIHYEPPANVEAFLQESGRAGRDGGPATSILLWNDRDRAHETDPVRAARERTMLDYRTTRTCLRGFLMNALGAESQACFGCDRCGPASSAVEQARSSASAWTGHAVSLVNRHRRVMTPLQLARSLNIDLEPEADRLELVASEIAAGRIRVHAYGPWRGRLTTGRRRHEQG